jgi:hypothetical protein
VLSVMRTSMCLLSVLRFFNVGCQFTSARTTCSQLIASTLAGPRLPSVWA